MHIQLTTQMHLILILSLHQNLAGAHGFHEPAKDMQHVLEGNYLQYGKCLTDTSKWDSGAKAKGQILGELQQYFTGYLLNSLQKDMILLVISLLYS